MNKSTRKSAQKFRRLNWKLKLRNASLLLAVCVLVYWIFSAHGAPSGHLSSPFVQPWFPAIISSYRITPQNKSSTGSKTEHLIKSTSLFLPEFKNPCYLQRNESDVLGAVLFKSESNRPSTLTYPSRVQVREANGANSNDVLRCLPYYFVLGWAKSGTSDLHAKMMAHPYILRPPVKEPAWVNNHRFKQKETFSPLNSYLDYYDFWVTSRMVTYFHRYGDQVPLIVGDHSTHTVDIYRGPTSDTYGHAPSRTDSNPDPQVLMEYSNPLLIKQVVPNAKFILLVREPVARLFSLYRMHEAISAQDFHAGCEGGIVAWNKCMQENKALHYCMYADLKSVTVKSTEPGSSWHTRAIGSVRRSIYHLYLQEWKSIFPREQFLVLKFEQWIKNSSDILNDQVFPFLDLPKLSGFNALSMRLRSHSSVSRSRPKKDGSTVRTWRGGDMLPETRTMLENFYKPYNAKLAQLLNDQNFDWQYS